MEHRRHGRVSGIGQGYIQVTPLQLATYVARVATGRAVQPHLTRKLGGVLQSGSQCRGLAEPAICRSARCTTVREGMWAVVNEPGGTAPWRGCADPTLAAGRQDRLGAGAARVARAARERTISTVRKLPWEFRPHALFVAYAPYDAPRYAVSVVIEHGNAGAAAAGADGARHHDRHAARDPANRSIRREVAGATQLTAWCAECRPMGRLGHGGPAWTCGSGSALSIAIPWRRGTSMDRAIASVVRPDASSGRSTGCTCCCCARWPASATPRCTAPPAARPSPMRRGTCCGLPPGWC